jgi:hypothetical protein
MKVNNGISAGNRAHFDTKLKAVSKILVNSMDKFQLAYPTKIGPGYCTFQQGNVL